jgi:hypothetical protein
LEVKKYIFFYSLKIFIFQCKQNFEGAKAFALRNICINDIFSSIFNQICSSSS